MVPKNANLTKTLWMTTSVILSIRMKETHFSVIMFMLLAIQYNILI